MLGCYTAGNRVYACSVSPSTSHPERGVWWEQGGRDQLRTALLTACLQNVVALQGGETPINTAAPFQSVTVALHSSSDLE